MFNYFFFFFASLLVMAAYYTIIIENPINALLGLISCFLLSSFLLFLFDLQFFALLILNIYIGAIAMFFLFVIMFLNITQTLKLQNFYYFFFFFIMLLFLFFFFNFISLVIPELLIPEIFLIFSYTDSLFILGCFLYTYTGILVFYAAFLLFIAMLGSIILLQNE